MILIAIHSLRGLLKDKAFVAFFGITFALSVGLVTAVMHVVTYVFVKPFPLSAATVQSIYHDSGGTLNRGFTFPSIATVRDTLGPRATAVAAGGLRPVKMMTPNGPAMTDALFVSEDYFGLLNLRIRGRLFSADEMRQGLPVAVITDHLWRSRMGGNEQVIGSSISVGDYPVKIIGIVESPFRGFELSMPADLFVPLQAAPLLLPPMNYFSDTVVNTSSGTYSPSEWLDVIVALRAGADARDAEAVLTSSRLATPQRRVRLLSIATAAVPAQSRTDSVRFMILLLSVVLLIVLIGAQNLGSIVAVRYRERQREAAIRIALGATRLSVRLLFLTEVAVLACLSGAAGLVIAAGALDSLRTFELPGKVSLESVPSIWVPETLVNAFVVAAALFMVAAIVPMIVSVRHDVIAALRGGTASHSRSALRGRWLIATGQLAVATFLLAGTLFFSQTVRAALTTDVGFQTDKLHFAIVSLTGARYPVERRVAFYDTVLARLKDQPGITDTSYGSVPFATVAASVPSVKVGGNPTQIPGKLAIMRVGPRYATVLRMPLVVGRDLEASDSRVSPLVAVVSESLARLLWGQTVDAWVGKQFTAGASNNALTVVGVVKDPRVNRLAEASPYVALLPLSQGTASSTGGVLIGSSLPAVRVREIVNDAISATDPTVPLITNMSFSEKLSEMAAPQRLGMRVLAWCGLLAIVLAAIGVFSVTTLMSFQRRHEMAIRVAVGATPTHVLQLLIKRGIPPIVIGVAVGAILGVVEMPVLKEIVGGLDISVSSSVMGASAVMLSVGLLSMVLATIPAKRLRVFDLIKAE